jgi:hypothetical protein
MWVSESAVGGKSYALNAGTKVRVYHSEQLQQQMAQAVQSSSSELALSTSLSSGCSNEQRVTGVL